jgi:SatD family (SatD)
MAKPVYATLIGDLVASRRAKSRFGLQRSLEHALGRANEILDPVQPLEPTVGDEFQGAFLGPIAAARASLLVRLQLLKDGGVDSRFGLGFGEVTVFERRTPISQDGPGWWSARAAIERAAEMEHGARTDFVRTYVECSSHLALPRDEVVALNAFLLCRDAIVAQMKPRSHRLLLGMILGKSQALLAGSGAYAIWASELELEGRLT